MKYALRSSFLFDIWKLLWHINTLILCNGIEWNCGHGRNLFYLSRSCFSIYLHTFVTHLNKWNTRWDLIFIRHLKTILAYKHTYFVQRNRMKCGHGRNLFYVSRSCFSFYLHTFLMHLNKWNTLWDFIFIRHFKTTCGI